MIEYLIMPLKINKMTKEEIKDRLIRKQKELIKELDKRFELLDVSVDSYCDAMTHTKYYNSDKPKFSKWMEMKGKGI